MFSIGIVGAGQFAGAFAKLFNAHPGISRVTVYSHRERSSK